VGAQIVRARDGLALSSRNAYLTEAERAIAPTLAATLRRAAEALAGGAVVVDVEGEARDRLIRAGFSAVDYFEARDPESFDRLGPGRLAGPGRILAAARLGRTRLIDNIAV
jgi:pantoate--beta-alanine ligase